VEPRRERGELPAPRASRRRALNRPLVVPEAVPSPRLQGRGPLRTCPDVLVCRASTRSMLPGTTPRSVAGGVARRVGCDRLDESQGCTETVAEISPTFAVERTERRVLRREPLFSVTEALGVSR
jgi:hypothetical protein